VAGAVEQWRRGVRIGETLAGARHQAGLTVAQVSQRTRIRETIIRAIEDDDYSACGGDFYARGDIRSIAKVVGTDSEPLIREYDDVHRAPGAFSTVTLEELLASSVQAPQRRRPDLSAVWERAAAASASLWRWLSVVGELVVLTYTTVRLRLSRSKLRGLNRSAVHQAAAAHPAVRRRLNWTVVLGVALVVALGFGVYRFLSAPQHAAVAPSAAGKRAVSGHHARHNGPNPAPKTSRAAVSPAPAAAVPAQRLTPASAAAFGPGGGDSPQLAHLVIGGHHAAGWHTAWYTTARFGNLYRGTGLLLDMGRPVTLTAAQITLGSARGASLQIRVGAAPALTNLASVAHAADTGGVVRLRLTRPAHGRYVLIWFTRLPADPSGTFQADVYNVRLEGRA
jgi:Helix-turn-helix domain